MLLLECVESMCWYCCCWYALIYAGGYNIVDVVVDVGKCVCDNGIGVDVYVVDGLIGIAVGMR